MRRYDEAALLDRLAGASPRARALFAARVAERLFPLYEFAGVGDPGALREALDATWSTPTAELAQRAEALVPDEDDDWVTASGYAQHAAAAVAYALRTGLTDDPQEAAWAARQAYDAADYAAQQALEDGTEAELLAHPAVQAALAGLEEDLAAALAEPADLATLRGQARTGGEQLVALVVR